MLFSLTLTHNTHTEQLCTADGCACMCKRRSMKRSLNVGQLSCSTAFLLKRPKQSEVQTLITCPLLHLTTRLTEPSSLLCLKHINHYNGTSCSPEQNGWAMNVVGTSLANVAWILNGLKKMKIK